MKVEKVLFCKKCGASIPPREGEGTCKEGCVAHYPPDPPARVCPKCKCWTTDRTSTGNGFCRPCGVIFAWRE